MHNQCGRCTNKGTRVYNQFTMPLRLCVNCAKLFDNKLEKLYKDMEGDPPGLKQRRLNILETLFTRDSYL